MGRPLTLKSGHFHKVLQLQQRQQIVLHMVIEKIFQATIVGVSIIAPDKKEASQETDLRDTATEVANEIPMSFGIPKCTNR